MPREITVVLSEDELEEHKAYEGITGKSVAAQLREALSDYRAVVIGAQVDVYLEGAIH